MYRGVPITIPAWLVSGSAAHNFARPKSRILTLPDATQLAGLLDSTGGAHRVNMTVVSQSGFHGFGERGPFQPDVGRFDIAMQQALCMSRSQPLGDLAADPDNLRDTQSTSADKTVFEGFAVEQLQDKERGLPCAIPLDGSSRRARA